MKHLGPHPFPVPEDFARYATKRSARELMARYGVSRFTIIRWRHETATAEGRRVQWSEGEDAYLRQHYGSSRTSDIAREIGRSLTSVRSRVKKLGINGQRVPRPKRPATLGRGLMDRSPAISGKVMSQADMAAAHIRSHDRTAVYHCDADGQANPKGTHWKYGHGSLVLTEQELIAKAERKGWTPDEWRRLVA